MRRNIYSYRSNTGSRAMGYGPRNNGAILVITLVLVSMLSVFGIGLARLTWSTYYFARWKADAFNSCKIAESVLLICKNDRKKDMTAKYDSLAELKEDSVYESGEYKGEYTMTDEERKININKASRSVLERLPTLSKGKASDIYEYEKKPFFPLEEILLVDGIRMENYDALKDIVTVYGDGQVNINTCSADVLKFLGFTDNMVEAIMDYRKGEDGEPDTVDDGVFISTNNIIVKLKDAYSLSLREQQVLISLLGQGVLCVKSSDFRISLKVSRNGKVISNYSMVISKDKDSQRWNVLEWRRE